MKVDAFTERRNRSLLLYGLLFGLTGVSVVITQFDMGRGVLGFFKALVWGATNFYPDAASLSKLPNISGKLLDTFLISISATVSASPIALLLAFLGSRSTRPHGAFTLVARGIGSLFRNIPLVAWAMILMFAFGQSSLTGFLALFLGSLGFLVRAFMEALDEVDAGTIEALKATGAPYYSVISRSVIPSSTPQIVSWLLFMIETNVRDATLVGYLTGTGIGFAFDVYYKSFNYHAASLVVIVTVISVLALEAVSNSIRRIIL